MEETLLDFRELLSTLSADAATSLSGLRKALHSMKGNLQAVSFLHFGAYIHSLETIVEDCETILKAGSVADGDKGVLEFFLSDVLNAMTLYLKELRETSIDTEALKNKRMEALNMLGGWAAEHKGSKPQPAAATPPVAPKVEVYTENAAPPVTPKTETPESVVAQIEQPPKAEEHPRAQTQDQPPVADKPEAAAPDKSPDVPQPLFKSDVFLLFENGRQHFAIPIEYVVEVRKIQKLCDPPQRRENFSGFLNLRGGSSPYWICTKFSLEMRMLSALLWSLRFKTCGSDSKLEQVHQVVSLDIKQFQEVPSITSKSDRSCISHFFQTQDKTISILNIKDIAAA